MASRRVTRAGEAKIRSFFARCFYKLINKISQTEIVDGARDFRMMTRQMTDSILSMCEVTVFQRDCSHGSDSIQNGSSMKYREERRGDQVVVLETV